MAQELHDSGKRRTFSSGAQRDRGTLKPRPDLISPHAQMREGMIFALGAKKYTERNWELGMPISQCLASAQRHIEQWKLGLTDEDHLAQARWNLGAILHYENEIAAGRMDPAFADMPHYEDQPRPWLAVDLGQDQDYSICQIFEPPVTERMCPRCGAHLRQEQYETGTEFFCIYCEWNSLKAPEVKILRPGDKDYPDEYAEYVRELFHSIKFEAPDHVKLDVLRAACDCPDCMVHRSPQPGDRRTGPNGPEVYVKLTGVGGWNPLAVDSGHPDQDYSICQLYRPPATFYICGPMRGLPFLNFPAFDGAKKLGESLGHSCISPADMDRMYGIDPINDPTSPERVRDEYPNFVHDIVERDIDVILRLNKDRGDGLALLPGWQGSVGGMAEVRLAYWLGLKFVDARDWKDIDIEARLGVIR